MKGYPLWPGKVIRVIGAGGGRAGNGGGASAGGMVHVRFFGALHDFAMIPLARCLFLSRQVPVPIHLRSPQLAEAIRELKAHIGKLRFLSFFRVTMPFLFVLLSLPGSGLIILIHSSVTCLLSIFSQLSSNFHEFS